MIVTTRPRVAGGLGLGLPWSVLRTQVLLYSTQRPERRSVISTKGSCSYQTLVPTLVHVYRYLPTLVRWCFKQSLDSRSRLDL